MQFIAYALLSTNDMSTNDMAIEELRSYFEVIVM